MLSTYYHKPLVDAGASVGGEGSTYSLQPITLLYDSCSTRYSKYGNDGKAYYLISRERVDDGKAFGGKCSGNKVAHFYSFYRSVLYTNGESAFAPTLRLKTVYGTVLVLKSLSLSRINTFNYIHGRNNSEYASLVTVSH